MSSLTEQERRGLDEVFLSITTRENKMIKWKQQLQKKFLLISKRKSPLKRKTALFNIGKRIKFTNFTAMLPKNQKKKKNLSK